jgi:peptide/nickel transport system ATP-binding protein
MHDLLLEVKHLKTHFFLDEGVVKAVDGVDLTIRRGRTLAVVGESGCGKSVMARSIMGIVTAPGKIVAGEILLHRETEVMNLVAHDPKSRLMRMVRGKEMGMIFQEPMAFLSPVHTIGNQIMENLRWHTDLSPREIRRQTIEMLQKVGIPKPERRIDAYPHELSGGMRQRAMIAMALINKPTLLIADEPTTALDVTTQAQILELLLQLTEEFAMTTLIITHDLGVVAEIADDVAVMYLGEVVETAPVDDLFYNPKHPYTVGLLQSIPRLDGDVRQKLNAIPGTVPHPYNRPSGCHFHPRCKARLLNGLTQCATQAPPMLSLQPTQEARCWLYASPSQPTSTVKAVP